MRNITNFPVGLNSLLQMLERGEQISGVEDGVRASIEIRELFLLNDRRVAIFPLVSVALGGNNFPGLGAQVPAGQLWFCWHYTVVGMNDAAEASTLAPMVDFPDLGTVILGPPTGTGGALASSSVAGNYSGFWAPPGSVFGFWLQSFGGAPQVHGRVVYSPLRI